MLTKFTRSLSRAAWRAALVLSLGLAASGCQRTVDSRIQEVFRLGRHPSEARKARLAGSASDPDRDVRAAVLVVMNSVDPARAGQLARTALSDPDGVVRAAAVQILGESGDASLTAELISRATDDPAWPVRARALEAIAAAADPAVPEAFDRALRDPVWHVRRAALTAGLARPELLSADAIGGLLRDEPDWENRVAASLWLGRSQDPGAYPALDAAIHDPNEFVRAAAAGSLGALQRAGVSRPEPPPPKPGPERPKAAGPERNRPPGV